MCNRLKKCIRKHEPKDCGECYKYTRRRVYSAKLSFRGNQSIQLCDCIVECDGFYIAVEHKTGKLNSEKLRDAENQLSNCERELKSICNSAKVMKLLLYENLDTKQKNDYYKSKLRKKEIQLLSIKIHDGKEICSLLSTGE